MGRMVIQRRVRAAEGCRVAQTHLNPIRQEGILLHPSATHSGCSEITIFTINRFAGWLLLTDSKGTVFSVPSPVWRLRPWCRNGRVTVSGGFRIKPDTE